MQFLKMALIFMAMPVLLACNSESSAPSVSEPISSPNPVKVSSPKTPAATQVKADAPKIELSDEALQLQRGKKVYRKCKACHTTDEGGRHRVGPNLYGVLGAKIASKDGFTYSKASKASEIIWTDENLDAFLKKPKDFLPGNRMTFVGLKKEEDRKAVIAYLHNTVK